MHPRVYVEPSLLDRLEALTDDLGDRTGEAAGESVGSKQEAGEHLAGTT